MGTFIHHSGNEPSCGLNAPLSPEARALYQDPDVIGKILRETRTIAIVGASADASKASHRVGLYLQSRGYKVIPVNPNHGEIFGEKCHPSLLDIPGPVDLVDVFRPPKECLLIAEQAVQVKAKSFWLQLRIVNLEAAELARKAGLAVVVDKCTKIEHEHL